MLFVDTKSDLTTKPYNFDIKFHIISVSYDRYGFFRPSLGVVTFLFIVGGFFKKIEYSGAKWHGTGVVPLL